MKRTIASLLAIFAVATAHAGSFGGPPPFTNGSPLQSGVEGSYQASARGNDVSGIIRFAYNSGGLPAISGNSTISTLNNRYVFFVAGTIVSGTIDAAIMDNKIAGVIEQASAPTVPPTLLDFQMLGGSFTANINTKSPFYSFKGKGSFTTFQNYYSFVNDFKLSGMRTSLSYY